MLTYAINATSVTEIVVPPVCRVSDGARGVVAVANIYIYQIFYDDASKAALDPGFLPLDNSRNERPDWREYHPIRQFLLGRSLENEAYYGFFSPRFASKTGLTSAQVKSFVVANEGVEVVLFCPQFDQSAFYLNVFEQGEVPHSGLIQASQELAKAAGIDVNLKTLVNDSSNTIFANYFVARRTFWTEWLRVVELHYERAEALPAGTSSLTRSTSHRFTYEVELKVFIMERLATLILATNDRFKTAVYDPTKLPMSGSNLSGFPQQAVVCDALKLAFRRFRSQIYLDAFNAIINAVSASLRSANAQEVARQRLGQ